ncbi:hypothetical protein L5515_014789 [Caenorhabditis briggsae]|uniref:Uncharacterized protein n=2 Tax=Caenorhabditis briggsae TaxID=6238 RepID=A0AAE9J7C9_CAEBR|nr:hypothetical protein L5515_014789 [Caenorhabditis briggsae]
MMMDDDWNTTGPLEKDIFISEIHNTDRETIDILKLFDNDDGFSDEPIRIKMEPTDETSVAAACPPASGLGNRNTNKENSIKNYFYLHPDNSRQISVHIVPITVTMDMSSCSSMPMPVPRQMHPLHMGMPNNCDMMHPMHNYPMKWEPCTPPDEKPPASMLFPPLPAMFNQSRHSSNGEDYHGSSSGSPSSSLSSPNEFKDEPLGLDINFGSSLFNAPFSPSATSSHSPSFGMMNSGHSMAPQQHSPLPSVAHFSHTHHNHLHHHVIQHHSQQNLQMGMNPVFPKHEPSYHSPQYVSSVPHNFLFKDAGIYEGMGMFFFS